MKFTSGGIVRGAPPICELRLVEAENDREAIGNAGRRKVGRDIEGAEAIARSRTLDLAVDNIVMSEELQASNSDKFILG